MIRTFHPIHATAFGIFFAALLVGCAGDDPFRTERAVPDARGVFDAPARRTMPSSSTRDPFAEASPRADDELPSAPGDVEPLPDRADAVANAANTNGVTEIGGWSILLERYPGADRLLDARRRVPAVQRALNRQDVYLRPVADGYAVVLGSYETFASERAQTDLDAVRALRVGDLRPYAGAWLVPPRTVVDPGERPELNLATARERWPEAKYTLQVEVYWPPEGADRQERSQFRRAAEERALELRRQGELAFYYHGRTRSMVTLGLFSVDDYDDTRAGGGVMDPELKELIERFPYNLGNGRELIQREADGDERRQRSMLVHVP